MFQSKSPLFPTLRQRQKRRSLFPMAPSKPMAIPQVRKNPLVCQLYPLDSSGLKFAGKPAKLPYEQVYEDSARFLKKIIGEQDKQNPVQMFVYMQQQAQNLDGADFDPQFTYRKAVMSIGCMLNFFQQRFGLTDINDLDYYRVAIAMLQNLLLPGPLNDALKQQIMATFPKQSSALNENTLRAFFGGMYPQLVQYADQKNIQVQVGSIGKSGNKVQYKTKPEIVNDDFEEPDLSRYQDTSLKGAADARIAAFLRNFGFDSNKKRHAFMKQFAFNIRYNGRTSPLPSAEEYKVPVSDGEIRLVDALYGPTPLAKGAVIVVARENGNAQVFVASRNTVSNLGKKSKQPAGNYWVPIIEMTSFPQGPILVKKGIIKNGFYKYETSSFKDQFPCCAPHTGMGAALMYARKWRASKLRYQEWPILAYKISGVTSADPTTLGSLQWLGQDAAPASGPSYSYDPRAVFDRFKQFTESDGDSPSDFDTFAEAFTNKGYGKTYTAPPPTEDTFESSTSGFDDPGDTKSDTEEDVDLSSEITPQETAKSLKGLIDAGLSTPNEAISTMVNTHPTITEQQAKQALEAAGVKFKVEEPEDEEGDS